jgi:hypothetical protein
LGTIKEGGTIMAVKITDLNEDLFAQFHRLQNTELTGEKLDEEISRSKASVEVAHAIIASAALVVQACRISETSAHVIKLPALLTE